MQKPLMAAYCQEVRKLEDKFQGIELHHVPRKDNDATDFLAKLATRRVLSLDGVFINDLHEPSARVLEGSIQTHSDTNLAPEGSNLLMCPDPDQVLGGSNLGASMTTSPANIAVVVLDPID